MWLYVLYEALGQIADLADKGESQAKSPTRGADLMHALTVPAHKFTSGDFTRLERRAVKYNVDGS